jgi:signal transduction histidine kinase/DNA-binding response OmpR family regulator
MIIGLNPYRPLDDAYRGFLDLLAGQIAAGLADVRASVEERKRAEALAEIDRAKTAFFSNASHEFRTPLTLMLGPLEDMLDRAGVSEPTPVRREEIDLVHRNGLRLLKLVNTLLDFSRIEAGRMRAVYEPLDLAGYTGELASTFESAMSKAELGYVIDCRPLPEPVHVDRDMWEKIVLNLLSNAFKYTLRGEIGVSVGPSADGKHAELVVRDTGTGIPAEELPRIFERFHRIKDQVGRSHEGTGIGLALVQELVKLHGGTVRVDSTVGLGTSFTVSIPMGDAHLPKDRLEGARSLGPAGARVRPYIEEALRWLPGTTPPQPLMGDEDASAPVAVDSPRSRAFVLVADDNADMRDYMRRLLGGRYDVEAVADGQAALARARQRRPDLILTDVMMPRMDGFTFVKLVRQDDALQDVPVIMLSARAGEEASIEGLAAGADDYLAKPFNARELVARVTANLDMAGMRRQAADALRDDKRRLEASNRVGAALVAELDLERLVQTLTDAAVELTGAQFGAFFYNVVGDEGEAYTLYTLSGAPREAFASFPMPRNTAVFEPTFRGTAVVRSGDITKDPRYGKNAPFHGMPRGHLPVRSYLAVPVVSRSGEVLGGLFLGHSEPDVFGEREELVVTGIAPQAAVAMDNARLYRTSRRAEEQLRELNETLEQRVELEIGKRMRAEEGVPPSAEDGGHRTADRRRGARFQQPLAGGHR